MRHALFLPPFGELADPHLLAELAAEAEASGWDGFFLWDRAVHEGEPVADPPLVPGRERQACRGGARFEERQRSGRRRA